MQVEVGRCRSHGRQGGEKATRKRREKGRRGVSLRGRFEEIEGTLERLERLIVDTPREGSLPCPRTELQQEKFGMRFGGSPATLQSE